MSKRARSPFGDRNRKIAKAYRAGALLRELADKYGLSQSRISYIVKQEGARLNLEDRRARCSAHSSRIAKDPEVRAKIAAAMRQRWAAGYPMGRKAILADDPERREEYLVLRDAFGAAYAREQMGLAA